MRVLQPRTHETSSRKLPPVQIIIGPFGQKIDGFPAKLIIKAGGWLNLRYQKLRQTIPPVIKNLPLYKIYLPHEQPLTVSYFCKALDTGTGTIDFMELFPPINGIWASWLDALIDVYLLAQRLGSEHVQNKLMDGLMFTLRDPVHLRSDPTTWVLTKFHDSEPTRSSPLVRFLVDYVAFRWLTNPFVELNGVPATEIRPAQSCPKVLLSTRNDYIIERLMTRVLQSRALAIINGKQETNPADKAFCVYHVHEEQEITGDDCPGANTQATEDSKQ